MLAMQEQWGMAFRAAGDIGRLRHQPGPVGVAMLSTGFAFIWLVSLVCSLRHTMLSCALQRRLSFLAPGCRARCP